MDYYIRKVVRKSKKRYEYAVTIPADIVRELQLQDSKVTIKVKGRTLIIDKVGEKIDMPTNDNDILI